MTDQLPWSERIRLDQIGQGLSRRLSADAGQRGRIAEALDLAALDRLDADLEIKPAARGWRLTGRVRASAVQTCGLTLEPLPVEIDAPVEVEFTEASDADPAPRVIDTDPETPDGPDVIEDGGVDLAAYAVEHLALNLDPWPRKPGAVFEAPESEAEPSPFAVLANLKQKS